MKKHNKKGMGQMTLEEMGSHCLLFFITGFDIPNTIMRFALY